MKNFFKKIALFIIPLLFLTSSVHAATTLTVPQGGTGVNTITGIVKGNGTAPFSPITIGTGLSLVGSTLSATGGAGTITNAQNIGLSGSGWFAGISGGNTLDFKNIVAGSGISLVPSADAITVSATGVSSDAWKLIGNSGLTDGTDNFLGTLDDVPLRFIQDNINAGQISSPTLANTFLGLYSGAEFTAGSFASGFENTGIGQAALFAAFDGQRNTALGSHAGQGVVSGQDNTLIGYSADLGSSGQTHVIALGSNAVSTTDNEFVIDPSVTQLNFPLNAHSAGDVLTSDGTGIATWQPASGNNWSLTTNAGLTDGVDNFFGTTDTVPVRFKFGVEDWGILDPVLQSVAIGGAGSAGALHSNVSGVANVAFGGAALNLSMFGYGNVAVGASALGSYGAPITPDFLTVGNDYQIVTTGTTDWTLVGAADSNPGTQFVATDVGTGTGTAAALTQNATAVGTGACNAPVVSGDNVTCLGANSGAFGDYNNFISLGYAAMASTDREFSIKKGLGEPEITHLNFPLNSTGSEAGYVLMNIDGNGIANWQPLASTGSITAGQVGYGDPFNLLTSDSNFTWDSTALRFLLGDLTNGANETKFYLLDDQASITATARNFQIVNTSVGGGGRWYYFDGSSNDTSIGDIDSVGNDTLFKVSDFAKYATLEADGADSGYGFFQQKIISDAAETSLVLSNTTGVDWIIAATGAASGIGTDSFFIGRPGTPSAAGEILRFEAATNRLLLNGGVGAVEIGDPHFLSSGTRITVDNNAAQITNFSAGGIEENATLWTVKNASLETIGYVDTGLKDVQFGDLSFVSNSVYSDLSNSNQWFQLVGKIGGVQAVGFRADYAGGKIESGDIQNLWGGTKQSVDVTNETIVSTGAIAYDDMQVFTGTGSVTIDDGVYGLYYDPATTQANATITLPATPLDGTEITILFGGTVATGSVVTTLTMDAGSGNTFVGNPPVTATANTVIVYKFRDATNQYYPAR